MHGHIQSLCSCGCGILRIYENGKSFENKDPYLWCCTVTLVDMPELCGITVPPTRKIWRAIVRTMKNAGHKKARFIRYRNGKREVHVFTADRSRDF